MELYLDRKLSEKRIFPAIDLNSGTLAAIESMLPVFLYNFNEKVIEIKQADMQISEITHFLCRSGNFPPVRHRKQLALFSLLL